MLIEARKPEQMRAEAVGASRRLDVCSSTRLCVRDDVMRLMFFDGTDGRSNVRLKGDEKR